jgi:hypothetical protein
MEVIAEQLKPPPATVEFYRDSEFTQKLDYYLNQKVEVTQVTTGKTVVRKMLQSPGWSLPNDATIYVRAEVPTSETKGKLLDFLVDWFGSVSSGQLPDPITRPAVLISDDGEKSVYKVALNLTTDKLPRGEVGVLAVLRIRDGAELGSAQTMYDSRELGFISGSKDREFNAEKIFGTIKTAFGAEYGTAFTEGVREYTTGGKNHLTDDMKFDTADFAWELMHGTAGTFHADPPLGTFLLKNVATLGSKNAEWAALASCSLFQSVNPTPGNRGVQGVFAKYPRLFASGLHLALGGLTPLHSNPYLMGKRYSDFAAQLKSGQTLAQGWTDAQALGLHGYGPRWQQDAIRGIAIGPNLKYKNEATNIEDKLPLASAVRLSPDFVALEDADLGAIVSEIAKDDQGRPKEAFPVTVVGAPKARVVDDKVELSVRLEIRRIPLEHLNLGRRVLLVQLGIQPLWTFRSNNTFTQAADHVLADTKILVPKTDYDMLKTSDKQIAVLAGQNQFYWGRSNRITLPDPE